MDHGLAKSLTNNGFSGHAWFLADRPAGTSG
jgi:hypothetical protein